MAPRVVRPRSDSAHWALSAVAALVALAGGYLGARRVFRPSAHGADTSESETASESAGAPDESARADAAGAGEGADDAAVAEVPPVEPSAPTPPAAPRVPVRVMHSVLQSCGDGEELTVPGPHCDTVNGLEPALRAHLADLGACSAAEAAAATPDASLSVGLRVDFPRHRVTALLGRSGTLHNSLTYLPCARTVAEQVHDVWTLHPAHARYLYFFTVRFGPLEHAALAPATHAPPAHAAPPEPTPSEPAAVTPTPAVLSTAVPLRRPETVTVVWERVYLRASPRTGPIVARVDRGTELTVVARQPGGWWQVPWRGATAWVFGQAIGREH